MRLIHPRLMLASMALLACGPSAPEDWMFDTFSEFGDGAGQDFPYSGLAKLAFDPDGTGTHTSLGACGRDVTESSFSWEPRGRSAVAIIPEPGEPFVFDTDDHEWRVARAGGCTLAGQEELALQHVRDGTITTERTIFRGDLCLERFECSDGTGDVECTDCRTVWCDEPPASCAAD